MDCNLSDKPGDSSPAFDAVHMRMIAKVVLMNFIFSIALPMS
jgi:hypothetical protein